MSNDLVNQIVEDEDETMIALEGHIEVAFDSFMERYEIDIEGSIEDMLFEFFSEGFFAMVALSEDDDEEE